MRLIRPVALILAGAIGALVLAVACGDDDSITDAGAADASCSCPSIEPRIRQYTQSGAITSSTTDLWIGAQCPVGSVTLGGGCWVDAPANQHIVARDSKPHDDAFGCQFINLNGSTGTVNATAICLVPEGTP